MKKYFKLLSFTLIVFVFLPCLSAKEKSFSSDRPIVWFVHGLITVRSDFTPEIKELKKIFPQAEKTEIVHWKCSKADLINIHRFWPDSRNNADQFVPQLTTRIEKLPLESQKRLILVGHSLGARIVIQTAVQCEKKGIKIKKVILAGSAINNNSPEIESTINISEEAVLNIVNPHDVVMKLYQFLEGNCALGTGWLYKKNRQDFQEITVKDFSEHGGYKYFEYLRIYLDSKSPKELQSNISENIRF